MPIIARAVVAFCFGALVQATTVGQVVDLPATGPQPSITEDGKATPLYSGSYALLISQRNYLGVGRQGWRPLDSTASEMDLVGTALRRHGFTVRRATDLSATDLISVFRQFMADFGYQPNNRLLFFFSGHGYTNTQTDMAYIVPVDALDPNLNPSNFYFKALPIETVQTWAREITARHALFVFDSCFSGSIFLTKSDGTRPDPRGPTASDRNAFFRGASAKPVRQFIAAGGPKEELPAKSAFVPLFLEALEGRASSRRDGYVTGKELGLWIEQTLPKYRANQNPHSGIIKQPELAFGDIVFQVPALAAAIPTSPTPPTPPAVVAAVPQPSVQPVPRVERTKVTYAADTFFASSSAELTSEGKSNLDSLVGKLRDVNLEIVIAVGHADNAEGGTQAAQQRLSVLRAEAAKAYLTTHGIETKRIYTEGKGSRQPTASNATVGGRAQNRRVELEAVGTRVAMQR